MHIISILSADFQRMRERNRRRTADTSSNSAAHAGSGIETDGRGGTKDAYAIECRNKPALSGNNGGNAGFLFSYL